MTLELLDGGGSSGSNGKDTSPHLPLSRADLERQFTLELEAWKDHPPVAGLREGLIVLIKTADSRCVPAIVNFVANPSSGLACLTGFGMPSFGEAPLFNLWARYDWEAEESEVVGSDRFKKGTYHLP